MTSCIYLIHNLPSFFPIQPSNIFFSAEGTVKVGDFGLVTAVDTQIETLDTLDDDQTSVDSNKKHTSQVGTQLYMSPEQVMMLSTLLTWNLVVGFFLNII